MKKKKNEKQKENSKYAAIESMKIDLHPFFRDEKLIIHCTYSRHTLVYIHTHIRMYRYTYTIYINIYF